VRTISGLCGDEMVEWEITPRNFFNSLSGPAFLLSFVLSLGQSSSCIGRNTNLQLPKGQGPSSNRSPLDQWAFFIIVELFKNNLVIPYF